MGYADQERGEPTPFGVASLSIAESMVVLGEVLTIDRVFSSDILLGPF